MEPEGSLPHSQVPATCPYLTYMNTIRKMGAGNGKTLRKYYVMYFNNIILSKAEKTTKLLAQKLEFVT
jgi:hypothetical protein